MAKRKPGKKRYNFLIDGSVYDDFSLLCEELGLVRSKKLEIFMKKLVEENRELIEKLKKERGKSENK